MMIDVRSLLRGRLIARAAGIDEMAQRLAGGEKVSPADIEAVIVGAGCTVDALQERVDCVAQRAELRQAIVDGERARDRLGVIDKEVRSALAQVDDAQARAQAVIDKHSAERLRLDTATREGMLAVGQLTKPKLLAMPQREQLAEAEERVRDCQKRRAEQAGVVENMQSRLEDAEARVEKVLAISVTVMPGAAEMRAEAKQALEQVRARVKAEAEKLSPFDREVKQASDALESLLVELRK